MIGFARGLLGTMAAGIYGVTVWHALYAPMPKDLPTVIAGIAITLGTVFMVCVALEPRREGEQGR